MGRFGKRNKSFQLNDSWSFVKFIEKKKKTGDQNVKPNKNPDSLIA